MPFGGTALGAAQIELIRNWIDQGAEWPEQTTTQAAAVKPHWGFIPPQRPVVPRVSHEAWPKNPIDAFILARLEKEGLTPSPEADRITLLRRLSLDLIGLPPTPEQVDAFLADRSPDAYRKQVERLLSSPHYGERWGRMWLDAARYADSDGFEKDKTRQVWFYRDWVINALNRDMPYNKFIIQQIAGDLLPNPTQDQIVATGFLRNSMINEEGGIDAEQFRMEAMFDRMDAIGNGMLGITIQCAQCHNHKFDPLKQEEYYGMFAFLNSSYEGGIAVYRPEEQMKREKIFGKIRQIEDELQRRTPDWQERMARWEEEVSQGQPEWIVVRPAVEDISTGGQKYLPLKDGSFLAAGYAPTKHRVKMTVRTDVQNLTAFRLELLTDPNLPRGGPGRSIKGTCALTEFEVEAAPADAPDKALKVKFAKATADFSPAETPLEGIFDDKTGRHRVTGPIEYAIDGKDEGGTLLTFYLTQDHGGWNSDDNQNNNLGRIRLSISTTPNAAADPLPKSVRDLLAIPGDRLQLLAHDGSKLEGRERTDCRIVATAPRRLVAACTSGARGAARDPRTYPRRLSKAGQAGGAGCAGLSPPPAPRRLLEGRTPHAPDLCGVAGRPELADHCSLDRQSRVAGLLWHRHCRNCRELRHSSGTSITSGPVGLACRGVHGRRLELEGVAPTDCDFGHVPPVVARESRPLRARSL